MRSLGSLSDWDPGFSTPFLFLKLFKLSLTPPKIPAREKLGTTNCGDSYLGVGIGSGGCRSA